MENRYINRFRSLPARTGEQIKNQDAAGNLSEIVTNARGSLQAQKKNTAELFATAIEMITGLTTHQQMMGVEVVNNMPLPSPVVRESPGMQLGYVQLTMRFLQAGLLHFMEATYEAKERIENLEKVLGSLAAYDGELDILGEMVALDIDSLESKEQRPLTPPESVKSDKGTASQSVTSAPSSVMKTNTPKSKTAASKK